MNSTHLHLLLNHFPVIGTLVGTVLLLGGVLLKNKTLQKASLGTIFLMALIAIPVYLTGEPAEDAVEKLPGVLESIIEQHEEAAEVAFWGMIAAGIFSLVSFTMKQFEYKAAKSFVMLSLVLSLVTSGLMIRAGYLGGQIRHTEVRSSATATGTSQPGNENSQQGSSEDDD